MGPAGGHDVIDRGALLFQTLGLGHEAGTRPHHHTGNDGTKVESFHGLMHVIE
jgi:hypothetical protein